MIEVAISSGEIDAEKAAIYAEAQVPEYWIVVPEQKRIDVYTQPVAREYLGLRAFIAPQIVVSEQLPAFRLELGTFFPD